MSSPGVVRPGAGGSAKEVRGPRVNAEEIGMLVEWSFPGSLNVEDAFDSGHAYLPVS